MTNISFHKEEQIIVIRRSGVIFIKDLLDLVENINQTYRQDKCLFVLDLIGESTSAFHQDDYPELQESIRAIAENFIELRHALVVSKPSDTALSYLYEKLDKSIPGARFKTFSTIDAAREWLKSSPLYPEN